jgi:2-polyprenyl-3-methyl-5-hydroxy-6-metoxy-1,4-benzoquinol methylase
MSWTVVFHFDTEIIIQLLIARLRIAELSIPTYYGDEICHVDGLKYAKNVVAAALKARLQELSLVYDRRFDCAPPEDETYTLKRGHSSPHTLALQRVRPGSRVLDLGCTGGYMALVLRREKRCFVSGVDLTPAAADSVDEFRVHDLNDGVPEIRSDEYDTVLLLDVIEHLMRPEAFLEQLRCALALSPATALLISTGNVGFIISRVMLLLGQFNYGKRGILDMTHTRLFTFASLRRSLEQAGFTILETKGVPAPFPLAIGNTVISRVLLAINELLIRLSRGMFAYQIFMRVVPQPTLAALLKTAQDQSEIRTEVIETIGADDVQAFQHALRCAGFAGTAAASQGDRWCSGQ